MMQDMCILVVSCDKYADCWTPFSDCMRKFWPDCPYPVYLCTESGEPENGAVYSKVFHEQTQIWTARVRKACEKIKESHILVVLEDQWPSLPVSTATVQNILGLMQSQENIGIVYLDKEVHGMPFMAAEQPLLSAPSRNSLSHVGRPCHLGPRFSVDSIS